MVSSLPIFCLFVKYLGMALKEPNYSSVKGSGPRCSENSEPVITLSKFTLATMVSPLHIRC